MRTILVFVLAALLAGCSMIGLGETPSQLEIVEYGLFKDGALTMQTNGVPREMGTSFGYRFRIKDPKSGPMKVRIITATPGLIDPSKSKVQNEYVTETNIQPNQTYDVIFTFSEPWEMVAGYWELRVETPKGEVLTHTFDVYKPNM